MWILGVIFFVQGTGMANVMPPATESVMSALPRERPAAARPSTTSPGRSPSRWASPCSAPSSRPSTAATWTAISPRCPSRAEAVSDSIEGAHAVASQLGTAGRQLADHADAAFVNAMHTASIAAAVIALLGALVVLKWMPGRSKPVPAAGTDAPQRPEKVAV